RFDGRRQRPRSGPSQIDRISRRRQREEQFIEHRSALGCVERSHGGGTGAYRSGRRRSRAELREKSPSRRSVGSQPQRYLRFDSRSNGEREGGGEEEAKEGRKCNEWRRSGGRRIRGYGSEWNTRRYDGIEGLR